MDTSLVGCIKHRSFYRPLLQPDPQGEETCDPLSTFYHPLLFCFFCCFFDGLVFPPLEPEAPLPPGEACVPPCRISSSMNDQNSSSDSKQSDTSGSLFLLRPRPLVRAPPPPPPRLRPSDLISKLGLCVFGRPTMPCTTMLCVFLSGAADKRSATGSTSRDPEEAGPIQRTVHHNVGVCSETTVLDLVPFARQLDRWSSTTEATESPAYAFQTHERVRADGRLSEEAHLT